jgi:ATP-binding cassette subfamily B protein
MDRQAFDRALEFLRYSRAITWIAIAMSLATAFLFVSLFAALSLFADLVINRGEIPCLANLSSLDRQTALQRLRLPDELPERKKAIEHWGQRYDDLKYPDTRLERLARNENPAQLTSRQQDLRRSLLWMLDVVAYLEEQVSPSAAELVRKSLREDLDANGAEVALNRNLDDFGILGLVVRTRDSHRRWLVHPIARVEQWTWKEGNLHYLQGLLIVGLALAALRAVCFFGANVLAARATLEAITRLRRALYLQTYRLGTLAFHAEGPSEAVAISTDRLESLHEGLFLRLTTYVREPVKFVLLFLFALLVNFWLALAFVLFSGLVWIVGGQIASHFRRQIRTAEQNAANQVAVMQESLRIMRLVKIFLMETFNLRRFEKQLAQYAAAQSRRYRSEAIYRPVFAILALVAVLVLLYLTGHVILNGYLGAAGALTMITALAALYWPAAKLLDARRAMRRGRNAAKILFDFLDRPGSVGQSAEAEFLPGLSKGLEFDKVTLKEPVSGKPLLRGVSMLIRAGQRVAIVGPDEAEKHAIVFLLSRFLDPTQGEIRIDKKNIRWVTLESLRVQVAMVLQHHLVFSDTVAHNIGCGEPSFNLARIIEAAKLAHAHHFIQKLPKGYETVVGEAGYVLKPAEMFRIALARAILRDAPLLVIEEPAVPLDDDTKALIDDTFHRVLPGRTVIFLPHRLSTIKSCDRVYFLHEGRIVDQGDHRDLLQNNDLYRHFQYLEFNEFDGIATTHPAEAKA